MPKKSKSFPVLTLDPDQQAMVNAREGVYAVLAGPGAGKTAALVERYRALVSSGVRPEDVLSLTFTAAAAKTMRERSAFAKTADSSWWRPYGFSTFHSVALSFCSVERENFDYTLAAFPLATEGQTAKLSGEASRKCKVDFKHLAHKISLWKREGRSPQQVDEEDLSDYIEAYQDFETRRRAVGVLDFDSMIMEMADMLERDSKLRDRWSFRFIMVDEFQDTDECQIRIVRELSRKYGNALFVGDPGQSIYRFRGSDPEIFLNIEEYFPSAKKIYLSTNYRSSREIVDFCKKIAPCAELGDKFHTNNPRGVPPLISPFSCSPAEAEAIKNAVRELDPAETVAILGRTNHVLRLIEDVLSEANIKFYSIGKSGFYSQGEVRDLLAFLQLAVSPIDSAVLTAIRAPFHPARYIRKKEFIEDLQLRKKDSEDSLSGPESLWDILGEYRHPETLQNSAISQMYSLFRSLQQHKYTPAAQAVTNIISDLRALEYYESEEESADADNSPKENIEEIIKTAGRFPTLREFLEHVRKIQNASRSKKGVALGTMHAAKGLEFDHVYLLQIQEGTCPHKRAESLDEEKRVFFVGASRAAKTLSISYCGVPSRFIQEFIRKPDEVVV